MKYSLLIILLILCYGNVKAQTKLDTATDVIFSIVTDSIIGSGHGIWISFDSTNKPKTTTWVYIRDTVWNITNAFEFTSGNFIKSFKTKYLIERYKVKRHSFGDGFHYDEPVSNCTSVIYYDDKKRKHVLFGYFYNDGNCGNINFAFIPSTQK